MTKRNWASLTRNINDQFYGGRCEITCLVHYRSVAYHLIFGTTVGCVLVMIASLLRWQDFGAVYLLIGGALYLVGTFLVTLVFNLLLLATLFPR